MSTSPAQIQANRDNAQFSTGPRTVEGKLRASRNAIRHGLTSQMTVLPNEDAQVYEEFRSKFVAGLNPQGALEEQLAQTLADTQWRLHRCRSIEQTILMAEPGGFIDPAIAARFQREQVDALNRFSLYEQRLTRNFQTTLKQFLALQAERKRREEQDLKDAAQICKHLRSQQLSYDPAEDGFVFSTAQLDTWMRRHQHMDVGQGSCLVHA